MSKGAIIGLAVGVVTVIVLIFVFTGGDTPESLIEEWAVLETKCSNRELNPQDCKDQREALEDRMEEIIMNLDKEACEKWRDKWRSAGGHRLDPSACSEK